MKLLTVVLVVLYVQLIKLMIFNNHPDEIKWAELCEHNIEHRNYKIQDWLCLLK